MSQEEKVDILKMLSNMRVIKTEPTQSSSKITISETPPSKESSKEQTENSAKSKVYKKEFKDKKKSPKYERKGTTTTTDERSKGTMRRLSASELLQINARTSSDPTIELVSGPKAVPITTTSVEQTVLDEEEKQSYIAEEEEEVATVEVIEETKEEILISVNSSIIEETSLSFQSYTPTRGDRPAIREESAGQTLSPQRTQEPTIEATIQSDLKEIHISPVEHETSERSGLSYPTKSATNDAAVQQIAQAQAYEHMMRSQSPHMPMHPEHLYPGSMFPSFPPGIQQLPWPIPPNFGPGPPGMMPPGMYPIPGYPPHMGMPPNVMGGSNPPPGYFFPGAPPPMMHPFGYPPAMGYPGPQHIGQHMFPPPGNAMEGYPYPPPQQGPPAGYREEVQPSYRQRPIIDDRSHLTQPPEQRSPPPSSNVSGGWPQQQLQQQQLQQRQQQHYQQQQLQFQQPQQQQHSVPFPAEAPRSNPTLPSETNAVGPGSGPSTPPPGFFNHNPPAANNSNTPSHMLPPSSPVPIGSPVRPRPINTGPPAAASNTPVNHTPTANLPSPAAPEYSFFGAINPSITLLPVQTNISASNQLSFLPMKLSRQSSNTGTDADLLSTIPPLGMRSLEESLLLSPSKQHAHSSNTNSLTGSLPSAFPFPLSSLPSNNNNNSINNSNNTHTLSSNTISTGNSATNNSTKQPSFLPDTHHSTSTDDIDSLLAELSRSSHQLNSESGVRIMTPAPVVKISITEQLLTQINNEALLAKEKELQQYREQRHIPLPHNNGTKDHNSDPSTSTSTAPVVVKDSSTPGIFRLVKNQCGMLQIVKPKQRYNNNNNNTRHNHNNNNNNTEMYIDTNDYSIYPNELMTVRWTLPLSFVEDICKEIYNILIIYNNTILIT